jgi:hypothetical protein
VVWGEEERGESRREERVWGENGLKFEATEEGTCSGGYMFKRSNVLYHVCKPGAICVRPRHGQRPSRMEVHLHIDQQQGVFGHPILPNTVVYNVYSSYYLLSDLVWGLGFLRFHCLLTSA